MKMTILQIELTDDGAVVSYGSNTSIPICCPRCTAAVSSGIEHRCGDKHPDYAKPKRKRKVAK